MKSLRNSKKGVSPIIATLLLIVIAVAAGVVTYSFVTGFIGSSTSQTGPTGMLSVDTYSFNASNNIDAYIRNTGGKAVTIQNVYLDGAPITFTNTSNILEVPVGAVVNLEVTNGSSGITNPTTSHALKIVCTDGTQLEFSVRKT